MEQGIQAFVAVNFLVLGISHVVQHRAWAEFFVHLHGLGRPGAFANGFLSLVTGTLIVSFHNVWSGYPMVVTLLGWSMVLKATVVFVFPEAGLRSMALVGPDNSRRFRIPGAIMIAVSAALGYSLWTGAASP